MTTLRAHFDGAVFVPDEPVNLPKNSTVDILLPELPENPALPQAEPEIIRDRITGFPVFEMLPGARILTIADVKAAEDEF